MGLLAAAAADITNLTEGTTHPSIQDAIDNAVNDDGIVADPDTSVENTDMLDKAITLRSQDPDDNRMILLTIINGGGAGSVITRQTGEDPDTVIAGFAITNGDADIGGGSTAPALHRPAATACWRTATQVCL